MKARKVEKWKRGKKKKKNPKIKNGLKKSEENRNERSKSIRWVVTRQEMILGLITL